MADKPIFKVVENEHFITKLIYNSDKNAFYKNMYEDFGINKCLVHIDMYDMLMAIVPTLKRLKLKLVIFDTLRPWAVQKFMYETAPDYLKPYIAPPPEPNSLRGFHPRGVAIDCYLADEDGNALSFPTTPDAFYEGYEKDANYKDYLKRAHRDYNGSEVGVEQVKNKELLESIMVDAGFEPLPTEWWHFNLKNGNKYPIIYSLEDVIIQ